MQNETTAHKAAIGLFALASVLLAYEPVRWLIRTWADPSYQSSGLIYVAGVILLVTWSATSRRLESCDTSKTHALMLLICAAALRLFSQVASINIIGGMALALDVFALLTWFGLAYRERAVSPFWVSVLFLFALPFERVAQRILGYPLQELSAFGACQILSPFFNDLACAGVRLKVAGNDVLVDLPCSGTVSLMLCLAAVVALNALFRPRFLRACGMIGLTLALSVLGNALRIALLATGIVFEDSTGIDVMAQPAHDLIGYATLLLSLAPVVWLSGTRPQTKAQKARPNRPPTGVAAQNRHRSLPALAVGFFACALLIISLPRQALDVSHKMTGLSLPLSLNGEVGTPVPLTDIESSYFEQFGGTAQKAMYGPLALTLVQTTSPLRHLHAPDDCLRGLGYAVTFLGTRFDPVPTALYRAEDASGRAWHVSVTFSAADGTTTSNVAEAIWHWLKHPDVAWQSVQRITPWSMDDTLRGQFEAAAMAALETSHQQTAWSKK
jgi:exosortase/archaeosortase family protein